MIGKFQISYEEFLQKIKEFEQHSTLVLTAKQCWAVFNLEKELFTINDEIVFSRIFAIAMATANNHQAKKINLDELNSLRDEFYFIENGCSYEPGNVGYHDILERIPDDSNFFEAELNEMILLINEDKKFETIKKYNISENTLRKALTAAFIQRELGAQIENPAASIRNMARTWAVLKFLNKRLRDRVDIIVFLKGSGGFNMQPLTAFTSAIAILEAAKSNQDGFFCLDDIAIGHSVVERTGIELNTLELMASRLAASKKQYQVWHKDEVMVLHPYYKKYAPSILYKFPLVDARMLFKSCPKNTYFCPSPSIFLNSISELWLRSLELNKEYFCKRHGIADIQSDIGKAYEDYIAEVIQSIFPSRKIIELETNDKNADFAFETDNAIWVIECKKSIGGANIRTLYSNKEEEMIDSFRRLLRACEQCAISAGKQSMKGKPVIPVVIVSSPLIVEGIIFQKMAYESKVLESLGLSYIEIFSLDDFERTFLTIEEKVIVSTIQQKWEKIKQGDNGWFCKDVLDIAVPKEKSGRQFEFPHLTPYLDEIFGNRPT